MSKNTSADSTDYEEMKKRRRKSNRIAQSRRRAKLAALQEKADDEGSATTTALTSDSQDDLLVREALAEGAEEVDLALQDASVLKYNIIGLLDDRARHCGAMHITALNPVQAFREVYSRLGLTADITERYDSLNPIPASYASYLAREHHERSARRECLHSVTDPTIHGLKQLDNVLQWDAMPSNMHPTPLQLSDDHHVFFDIFFPWPQVRDRLLISIKQGQINEKEFCEDLLLHPTIDGNAPPFYIWQGDPTDVDNWEISEGFARKYCHVFDQAILRRTNWWRAKRLLEPI